MRRFISLIVLFAIACASGSGSRPSTIPQPGIQVGLMAEVFFGSLSQAPASIQVLVENRSSVPITLRRIELSSPGMTQWAIYPLVRELQEPIPAGQTKSRTVTATAETTVARPTEPLALRAVLHFESGGVHWREIVMTR